MRVESKAAALSLATLLCCGAVSAAVQTDAPPADPETARVLALIDRLEDLYLALAPQLRALERSVLDLELPDLHSERLFAARVAVTDLAPSAPAPPRPSAELVALGAWPINPGEHSVARQDLELWRPFLDAVDFFDHVHFKIVKGRFLDREETSYLAAVRFTGSARLTSRRQAAVSAELDVRWTKSGAADPAAPAADWRIERWRTRIFRLLDTSEALYEEVLDRAIPDPATLSKARTSLHEKLVRSKLTSEDFTPPHRYFQSQSLNRHPGLAVVDVDRDGFDDLYVMARFGANLLLRNRGDGTFEEIAGRLGLDVRDHTSSALFADFDNDGDPDVFLGRTLAPSLYLVNEGGRFHDRSQTLVGVPLPHLVSSISAVDDNGDGLLDVYFSTYGIDEDLQQDFLPPAEARAVAERRRRPDSHRFHNRPGPPNLLLRNLGGGRFDRADNQEPLEIWRNTYQSTWADFDRDGDPDVYVANDFAPNNLLRNDGDGRFQDVTAETATADVGFGMGASWGDYDGDGWQDLYVTNMYSSAGRRITAELGPVGERLAPIARGNSLLRNPGGGPFERVSGLEPPALLVERAGWGWGGQFLDVDNDGHLDIYALAGYYTAPWESAAPPDL